MVRAPAPRLRILTEVRSSDRSHFYLRGMASIYPPWDPAENPAALSTQHSALVPARLDSHARSARWTRTDISGDLPGGKAGALGKALLRVGEWGRGRGRVARRCPSSVLGRSVLHCATHCVRRSGRWWCGYVRHWNLLALASPPGCLILISSRLLHGLKSWLRRYGVVMRST